MSHANAPDLIVRRCSRPRLPTPMTPSRIRPLDSDPAAAALLAESPAAPSPARTSRRLARLKLIGSLFGLVTAFQPGFPFWPSEPRTGYSNPWLGCKVFVLLSRSMLRSLRFRSLNAARSRCSSSLEGFSPTLLLVVSSSATQRLLSVAARRPLPAWHRQPWC